MSALRDELAPRILPVVLANITSPYPYHDAHLTKRGEPPHDPIAAHPAFGNSFDWHSSVHSHWTAVQLLDHFSARFDAPPEIVPLEAAVAHNLRASSVEAEIAYLQARPSYERPYGWAWAMMLAAAAHGARSEAIRQCSGQLRVMADWIGGAVVNWLGVSREPVRHGVHSNTAFSLGLMLDAARVLERTILEQTIAGRARAWFAGDRNWPQHWERSGHDFLSPGLAQADLMRRILAPNTFAAWWSEFLPQLRAEARILSVVEVPDVADGHIAHLHGLNLSRAAMLARIAPALQQPALLEHARRLYAAGVEHAVSGDYLSTHWLPTFAWEAAVSIDGSFPR